MKTSTLICLSLLVGAGALSNAAAQPAHTDANPATLYYQAFLLAPDPMSEADSDYLASKEGRTQKLPERFDKIFAGYDNQFKLVRQAAQSSAPCDWGIDFSPGPATLLPHLARVKAVAVASRFRVVWELQHDRQADARDDLLASLALSRNVARDGTLISALVQIASESINCWNVAENFGQFSPETLQQLAAGLEALPPRTTVAQCVPTEKALFGDWLLRKIVELQKANPGDDAKVMAALRELFPSFDNPEQMEPSVWAKLSQDAGGTSEGVAKLIRDSEASSQKLALILALPHGPYELQMAKFKAEVAQVANPFISNFLTGVERARMREFRVLVFLAQVRAAIEYKLHGEAGLQTVADPCGQGPFGFRRFVFEGIDRGFELSSAYDMAGNNGVIIFVEKEGPPFRVGGPFAGQAITNSVPRK
ncbi:MAG TPA: hypothetical protein VN578_19325 [Candidatus Binatia bacterium]|jgi:hypothetical protein|nr:hypothetical protein [Candidatus Binatia bacterium]